MKKTLMAALVVATVAAPAAFASSAQSAKMLEKAKALAAFCAANPQSDICKEHKA